MQASCKSFRAWDAPAHELLRGQSCNTENTTLFQDSILNPKDLTPVPQKPDINPIKTIPEPMKTLDP